MARTSIWLRKFDRDADFIIERAFLFGGEDQRPGRVFDKSFASTRRLRQLYENRQIRHAEPGEVSAEATAGNDVVAPGGDGRAFLGAQERTIDDAALEEGVPVGGSVPAAAIEDVRINVDLPEGVYVAGLAARHVGRGRWAIFRGDDRVSDELYDGRAAAEAALAALQG